MGATVQLYGHFDGHLPGHVYISWQLGNLAIRQGIRDATGRRVLRIPYGLSGRGVCQYQLGSLRRPSVVGGLMFGLIRVLVTLESRQVTTHS